MKKNKKIYEAPLLTVVEFRTEKGFAASDDNYIVNSQQAIQAFIDKVAESNVVSRNAVRSGDVVLEYSLDSGNGVLLRGAVYEKGYVRIYGFNQVLVDIGEDAVKPILEMIND